jgi:hypothetical protein
LVDYQTTRLQLLLDIGALDTSLPKFWLKDHLVAFVPSGVPGRAQSQAGEQAVLPPERYFKN